jgi:prevent-host-death family protein
MEFVSVRELRINTAEVWEKLDKEKDLIITSNGKPIALMTGIAASNLENVLAAVRRARGEWAIRQMRRSSQEKGTSKMAMSEIDEEVRKARQERQR